MNLYENGRQNGGNQSNFQGNTNQGTYCTYCCWPGHHKGNCLKLRNKSNRNTGTTNNNQERKNFNSSNVAFTSIVAENNFLNEILILDSGASSHYCQSLEGLTDVKHIDELIKIVNNGAMRACKTGNLSCEVTQLDGSNLFSLNRALKNGFKLTKDEVIVNITKKHVTVTFDQVIKTLDDGCVTGVMMPPIFSERACGGYAHTIIEKEKSFDINHLHRIFGHCGHETLKNTVKMYG
jgi:hypothetical protein